MKVVDQKKERGKKTRAGRRGEADNAQQHHAVAPRITPPHHIMDKYCLLFFSPVVVVTDIENMSYYSTRPKRKRRISFRERISVSWNIVHFRD